MDLQELKLEISEVQLPYNVNAQSHNSKAAFTMIFIFCFIH